MNHKLNIALNAHYYVDAVYVSIRNWFYIKLH